jgi:carboxymethylenebutenolidase
VLRATCDLAWRRQVCFSFSMNMSRRSLALLAVIGALEACGSGEAPAPAPGAVPDPVAATAAEHAHDAPAPTPLVVPEPKVPVLEQRVAYGESATSNLEGYLAMPADAAEPPPGIIVIHEWWGLNDNIKAVTRRLAGEGYVVLAIDLYGGATATTPEVAQALMTTMVQDPEAAGKNIRQAYDYLDKYALAPRVASVGWCLGGGWSLQAASLLPDALDASVMYYGQVMTDRNRLAAIDVPLLGFFGALDASIPVRDVQTFRTTLLDLGKNAEILIYPRADHAFANPSGGNYNEEAANDSWEKTLAFLARHLKLSTPTQ